MRRANESTVAWALVMAAAGLNFALLWPAAREATVALNDETLHQAVLQRVLDDLRNGADPLGIWLPDVVTGFPLLHHYQPLSYIVSAVLLQRLVPDISVLSWLNVSRTILLSLFPLSIFVAMRRMTFAPLVAAASALLAGMLSTNALYGFDHLSYFWRGYGLYTQLWGMVLGPLALASGLSVMRDGQGVFAAVFFIGCTVLTHLVIGYIVIIGLGAVALLLGNSLRQSATAALRLISVGVLTLAVTSFFFVLYLLDSDVMNRSVWEASGKYDSFGHQTVLTMLLRGELFDFDRFPTLTILVALGALVCIMRRREPVVRPPVILFAIWLMLYFGRPTWGGPAQLAAWAPGIALSSADRWRASGRHHADGHRPCRAMAMGVCAAQQAAHAARGRENTRAPVAHGRRAGARASRQPCRQPRHDRQLAA